VSLYRAKFDGVLVFGELDQVFPREDAPVGVPMLHLDEQWCNAEWRYLKVLLPSGFVGWVLLNNLEEVR
jgi:hypothetical protein